MAPRNKLWWMCATAVVGIASFLLSHRIAPGSVARLGIRFCLRRTGNRLFPAFYWFMVDHWIAILSLLTLAVLVAALASEIAERRLHIKSSPRSI
jgi:hypothetical protein